MAIDPATPSAGLRPVVEALCDASAELRTHCHQPLARREFPSRAVVYELLEDLRSVLFPGFFGPSELTDETLRYHVGATLDKVLHGLQEQIRRGFCSSCHPDACYADHEDRAFDLAWNFIQRLPEVRRLLATDVAAAYEGDPALRTPEEAVFCYPGIQAITNQRLAHELLKLEVPLLPRLITEHAHSLTGIDIHPGARIGESFFIDHGTGVVIGETCIIGRHVRIYQGVTLGAKSFPLDEEGKPIKGIDRHPIVEDDVVIYAGATILGRVTIGKASTIGGNVWLTRSVPPGSAITQGNERG
jgi:serine O-acetyltransferase